MRVMDGISLRKLIIASSWTFLTTSEVAKTVAQVPFSPCKQSPKIHEATLIKAFDHAKDGLTSN